jgi:hypothetical protein
MDTDRSEQEVRTVTATDRHPGDIAANVERNHRVRLHRAGGDVVLGRDHPVASIALILGVERFMSEGASADHPDRQRRGDRGGGEVGRRAGRGPDAVPARRAGGGRDGAGDRTEVKNRPGGRIRPPIIPEGNPNCKSLTRTRPLNILTVL